MKATIPEEYEQKTGRPGLIKSRRPAFRSIPVLSGAVIAIVMAVAGAAAPKAPAAGHSTPPRAPASAGAEYQSAPPPGLILPGEKVILEAWAQTRSFKPPAGVAFVRRGTAGGFTRLPMRWSVDVGFLRVRVPARFLTGKVLEDYVVIRDSAGGSPVTVPAAGAAAPYRSWIVSRSVTIPLGAHAFGRYAKPQAIVASAGVGSGPGQVGFYHSPDASYGPSSVDVAADGTVWVADRVNSRLLAYAPGKPGAPKLTVNLPTQPMEVAAAPAGRIYVMTGHPGSPQDPRRVYAFGPAGKQLWAQAVTGNIANSVMRVDGDGIPWINDEMGWIPVTDRAGRPLTIDQQTRQIKAYQQLGGGWQLPDTIRYPTEDRIGLATPGGTLQRCWRLRSAGRDAMDPAWPQSRVGRDIVEFAEVGKQTSSGFRLDYLIIRFSPTGKVLSKITLDPGLIYGTWPYTHVRAGLDGSLYYLQTSDKWGMRVARYSWAGSR